MLNLVHHKNKLMLFLLCIVAGSLIRPIQTFALSTNNVPAQSQVYTSLDLLYSFGLLDSYIKGYRPYSHAQVANYALNAKKNLLEATHLTPAQKQTAEDLITELESEFQNEILFYTDRQNWKRIDLNIADSIQAEIAYRHDNPRGTPTQTQGFSAATVAPLTSYKNGRHYIDDGFTFNLSTTNHLNLSQYVALAFTPLAEFGFKDNSQYRFNAQTINAKFNLANISLQVGRDELTRHFGFFGGLTHTTNARNFDKIELGNDLPFEMPWIFRHLGSHKISAFAAIMGPENALNDVYLTGWSWHMLPLRWLEVGVSHFVFLGGGGQPAVGAADAIEQFFGFLPGGSAIRPGDSVFEFSSRIAIPGLRFSEFYLDFAFDDLNSEPEIFFLHDSAYLAGIFIPRLDPIGKWNLRFEFQRNAERMYKHGAYVSGKTLNNNAFGSHLGSGSTGVMISSNHTFNSTWNAGASLHLEQYSGDNFAAVFAGSSIVGINKSLDLPEEYRFRARLHAQYNKHNFSIAPEISYETVKNFNFTSGNLRHNVFLLTRATYYWDK